MTITGISILIPCYNYKAARLLQALRACTLPDGISHEIIIAEDGSLPGFSDFNRTSALKYGAQYLHTKQNLGRVGIRKLLAESAAYSHLWFIDVDCSPVDQRFIERAVECLENHPQAIVAGGMLVSDDDYADNCSLRWWYAKERECLPALQRQENAYQSLFLSNLIILKEHFRFFEVLRLPYNYGHEDTLIAAKLKEAGVGIQHIENPVYHHGLEDNAVFLAKTYQAVGNYAYLVLELGVQHRSKLWSAYQTLNRYGLAAAYEAVFELVRPEIELSLIKSGKPSIPAMDLLKLLAFVKAMKVYKKA